jgi:hypothetical protein
MATTAPRLEPISTIGCLSALARASLERRFGEASTGIAFASEGRSRAAMSDASRSSIRVMVSDAKSGSLKSGQRSARPYARSCSAR